MLQNDIFVILLLPSLNSALLFYVSYNSKSRHLVCWRYTISMCAMLPNNFSSICWKRIPRMRVVLLNSYLLLSFVDEWKRLKIIITVFFSLHGHEFRVCALCSLTVIHWSVLQIELEQFKIYIFRYFYCMATIYENVFSAYYTHVLHAVHCTYVFFSF